MIKDIKKIFARPSIKFPGAFDILHVEDGSDVCRIDAKAYPVVDVDDDGDFITSEFGVRHEHPMGITLTFEDAQEIGIEIE